MTDKLHKIIVFHCDLQLVLKPVIHTTHHPSVMQSETSTLRASFQVKAVVYFVPSKYVIHD